MARGALTRGKHFTTRPNTNATDSQRASASPPVSSRTRNAIARAPRATAPPLLFSNRASTPVCWPSAGSNRPDSGPASDADNGLVAPSSSPSEAQAQAQAQAPPSHVASSSLDRNPILDHGPGQDRQANAASLSRVSGGSPDQHLRTTAAGLCNVSGESSDGRSDVSKDPDIPNPSNGSDRSSAHQRDNTNRPLKRKRVRRKRRPRGPFIAFFGTSLLSVPLVVFEVCRHVRVAPPCHVQENPNLLVPCAIAVDLNRALSAIPRYVGPADPNDVFRHKMSDELYYDQHTPLSGLGVSANRYSCDHKTQTTRKDELRRHLEGATAEIDKGGQRNSSSFFERARRCLFEGTWLQRLLSVETDEETKRTSVTTLAKETFIQVYDFVSLAWKNERQQRIIAHARNLVGQKLAQQRQINTDVHQLWATRAEGESAITAERLVMLRQSLLRVLLAEAVLVCWLEGVDEIQAQRRRLAQQVWKDGQMFLHRTRDLSKDNRPRREVDDFVRKQLSTWSNELDPMTAEGEEEAIKVERSCAKRWAKQKLGHCVASVAGAADDNPSSHATAVGTPPPGQPQLWWPHWSRHWRSLDPAGTGCISHPDRMLWEWHNAIPIALGKHQDVGQAASARQTGVFAEDTATGEPKQENDFRIFTKEQFSRFWMHRVVTQADIAQYIKVGGGSQGVTVELDEAIPFGIGPLRFVKTSGG